MSHVLGIEPNSSETVRSEQDARMESTEASYEQLDELARLIKEIDDVYNDHAAKQGLSSSAFWIFYAVSTRKGDRPYTQRELCSDWSLTPQTVNSSLKRLRGQNLVELVALPSGRREKGIVLTKAGESLSNRMIGSVVEAESRAFSSIPEEDRAAAIRTLRQFRLSLTLELEGVSCK